MRYPRKVEVMQYKRPGEVVDYDFNFTRHLAIGDAIASSTVTVLPSGLTLGSKVDATPRVKQWVSAGTAGVRYSLKCVAVTTGGRTHIEYMVIAVADPPATV